MAELVEDFEDATLNLSISGTWARSSESAHAGSWALRSAVITDDQTTDAVVTIPDGATSVQFWYRVSSELDFDFFRVLVGATQVLEASGDDGGWVQSSPIDVTGASTLTFRYTKDSSTSDVVDAAFVDDIVFTIDDTPPPLLPADVLDLSCWHLTTPEDDGSGEAEQIDQPALDSFESTDFFVDEDGFVTCRAPVDGFTTSGASGATRMEFRQRRKGTYALAAMDPTDTSGDRWQMTVTTHVDSRSITGGSDPRQETICAQIHGAGDSPIPLILAAEFDTAATPRLRIFKNGPGLSNPVNPYTPDGPMTIRIRLENARVKLWAIAGEVTDLPDPATTTAPFDWPISDFTDQEGWYFKAGAYNKTEITSGSSGASIARISYLKVLEPSDPEEATSTTFDRTGGAAAPGSGSGAKTVASATTYSRTGGASTLAAGSGARILSPATAHTRAGGATAAAAGSGARSLTPATTHDRAGGAIADPAGSGSRSLLLPRVGGAVATGAATGGRTLDLPRTGGASAGAAGAGARVRVRSLTGGAAAAATGSGSVTTTSAGTHDRTGGASASGTGTGSRITDSATVYDRTGGAVATGAGSGASETGQTVISDRTGGASATGTGTGALEVGSGQVYTRTGGASAAAAGTGLAERLTAAVHARSGGAVVSAAGSGVVDVQALTIHSRTGGAAGLCAGSGAKSVVPATTYVRSGGGVFTGAGIAVLEVIEPTTYVRSGGAACTAMATGRLRVGGRLRAAAPVAIGQFRAGAPVRR